MRPLNLSLVLAPFSSLVLAVEALVPGQITFGHASSGSPFNPSFNRFVEQLMDSWHVPGLAIAVVHENKTWTKGFGYASLPDEPFTPYTLFEGASTTKSFTASLAALLVDNKDEFDSIDWRTPLHDVLGNDFVLKESYSTNHVTFLDALSHRTGIPRHDAVWYDRDLTVKEQAYLLRHVYPSVQLREKWQYNNVMYSAVSHALQTVTGRLQGALLREWLWEPLGMNHSFYSRQDAASCGRSDPGCKLADSYTWNNETSSYQKWPLERIDRPDGAGGIISNVVDYSRWVRALMYEAGPVSKEGHTTLKTPLSVIAAELPPLTGPAWYGMGLEGGVYRNERVFGHTGGIAAYASCFKFLPERNFGVVVFQNSMSNTMQTIGYRLIDEFLGVSEEDYGDVNKMQVPKARHMDGVWLTTSRYTEQKEKSREEVRAMPSKLYPSVPPVSIPPQLPLQNYTGTYSHAAYGDISVSLEAPSEKAGADSKKEGPILYATSKHQSVLYTFRHVSAEHWLIELRYSIYNSKEPDAYSKGRFDVGADGVVGKVGAIMEAAVQGDEAWAWFERGG